MSPAWVVRLVAAALVLALAWWAGKALYDRGVADERAVWVEAQREADRKAAERERDSTRTSEEVADKTREQAREQAREDDRQTQEAVEVIRYVYRDRPAAPCPADGSPRPVPERVLDQLDQAVRAAAAPEG